MRVCYYLFESRSLTRSLFFLIIFLLIFHVASYYFLSSLRFFLSFNLFRTFPFAFSSSTTHSLFNGQLARSCSIFDEKFRRSLVQQRSRSKLDASSLNDIQVLECLLSFVRIEVNSSKFADFLFHNRGVM